MKFSRLNYVNNIMYPTLFVFIALLFSNNDVLGMDRCFHFFIENPADTEVEVKVITRDCYEGAMPNQQKYYIKPGETQELGVICRVQGNGCDGKNGYFSLEFSPSDDRKNNTVHFSFTNSGTMYTYGTNIYAGELLPKSNSDNSYTYRTVKTTKVTAGKVTGSWERICEGHCNETISVSVTDETNQTNTVSSEIKTAISASLELGMEFEIGASAKATITASREETLTNSFTEAVMHSTTRTKQHELKYSLAEMRELDIVAVYQWVGKTTMSDGKKMVIKTEVYTFSSDGKAPNYLPNSQEHINAIKGKND